MNTRKQQAFRAVIKVYRPNLGVTEIQVGNTNKVVSHLLSAVSPLVRIVDAGMDATCGKGSATAPPTLFNSLPEVGDRVTYWHTAYDSGASRSLIIERTY